MRSEVRDIDEALRPELDRAWRQVERRIAVLPPALKALGRRFLAARRPGGSHRDYFSDVEVSAPLAYLPLWMRAALRRSGDWPAKPRAELTGLLAATLWGYFYIRIQDDVLDERLDEGKREALLFGNVCVYEMSRGFEAAAGRVPGFSACFERAWIDFSRWTLEEREQLRSDGPYPRRRFEAHAGKVAFAEVPVAAVCLLAGRGELLPAVSRLVRALGTAYGLLNDVRGFARDAGNGQRTYLLARAGWRHGPPVGDGLPQELQARLYEGGLLFRFLEEARVARRAAARAARELGFAPEFKQFLARQEGAVAELERRLLALSLLRTLGARP